VAAAIPAPLLYRRRRRRRLTRVLPK
jgi:hypothetical protein